MCSYNFTSDINERQSIVWAAFLFGEVALFKGEVALWYKRKLCLKCRSDTLVAFVACCCSSPLALAWDEATGVSLLRFDCLRGVAWDKATGVSLLRCVVFEF